LQIYLTQGIRKGSATSIKYAKLLLILFLLSEIFANHSRLGPLRNFEDLLFAVAYAWILYGLFKYGRIMLEARPSFGPVEARKTFLFRDIFTTFFKIKPRTLYLSGLGLLAASFPLAYFFLGLEGDISVPHQHYAIIDTISSMGTILFIFFTPIISLILLILGVVSSLSKASREI
jgi:hypothetical protein